MKKLPNCNLLLKGAGLDTNGNWVVRVSFPNGRAFAIQTNGVLNETDSITRATKSTKKLSEEELAKIGEEVCAYVREYGSKDQKSRLKIYKAKGGSFFDKLKSAGSKAIDATGRAARKIHKVAKPHVKKAYSVGKQKAKEAYHAVKEKTKDKIHDTKKDIALSVLDETIHNTKPVDQRRHLVAAEELVQENYVRTPEEMAKGGSTSESAEVSNIHKNIMGTMSFDLKIKGMRKPQDFIVYPIHKNVSQKKIITIQSDTRIGRINLENGQGEMSQNHSSGACFVHLQMDTVTKFQLSDIDTQELRMNIFTTSGSDVGDAGISSDNSGASDVLAEGGSVDSDCRCYENPYLNYIFNQ